MLVKSSTSWRQNSAVRKVGRLVKLVVHAAHLEDPGYKLHRGSVLPPCDARMGGVPYQDDEFFLASAIREARRVVTRLRQRSDDFIVDFGCGEGRLPIGLIHEGCAIPYLGLDVKRDAIAWCNEHLARRHPNFHFEHVDVLNARYNPGGAACSPVMRSRWLPALPISCTPGECSRTWSRSTSLHMRRSSPAFFVPGGRLFLTAHLEDGVPDWSVNPDGYTPYACDGPLHAVRYARDYFLDVLGGADFMLNELAYHAAGNCQSELYFVKR